MSKYSSIMGAASPSMSGENLPSTLDTSHLSMEKIEKGRDTSHDVHEDGEQNENRGEVITKAQKCKTWCACALQAFWLMGLIQSFGIFQAHYGRSGAVDDGIIRPGDMTHRAGIAAIHSLGNGGIVAAFALFFYSYLPRIGKHIRTLCAVATLLTACGFGTAAACQNLWQLLVTQGLLVGIGGGIFLNTLSTILPEYFVQHAGLAQGAVMSAGCIGGAILSLSLPKLLEAVGSRWTLGIMSMLSLCFLSGTSTLAQPPRKFQRRSTEFVGWRTFRNPIFTLLFLVNLIHPLTLAIPTTFGPEFSESLGYDLSKASIFLAISSLVGLPSRLIMGVLADYIGHNNMLFLATTTFALSTFGLWLPAALTGTGSLWITYNVIYGIVYGVFMTVINSVQKGHFGDELYYSYNGVLTSIRGVGYVVGVPVAGSLVSRVKDVELHGDDFVRPIIYMGTLLTISAFCMGGVRWLDARKTGWKWVK